MCNINGPTVVDPTRSTLYVMGRKRTKPTIVEKIKPYPWKFDGLNMAQIKNVTLISGPKSPQCGVRHNAPALVFSASGNIGNFYHDFNDGLIPLFITINTILPDQDFVIVLSEGPKWWPTKYADIINVFTKHPVVFLQNDAVTHCFPSAYIGLISHGFMTINQTLIPNSKTYSHFHDTIHKAFGHHSQTLALKNPDSRPRLVLATRTNTKGREMVNQREAIRVMEEVGFEVVVFEPNRNTALRESYALINSSHALIGVHGATLAHLFFLRPGSVFMQIVPIGVEWASEAFFGRIGRKLKLEYMEYRIKVEESSLVRKYGKDNLMLTNPFAVQKGGWPPKIMDIYLKEQNVELDLVRFKGYLKEAYIKAKKFMDTQGSVSLLAPKNET